MKSLEKLISHTILATNQQSEFFVSTNSKTDTHVCLDLWSSVNDRITHVEFRWVQVLNDSHAQEIAELWLEERDDVPIEALAQICQERLHETA